MILPQWAPRVAQKDIWRLYHLDALGIQDETLLDKVGWALRSRCQSFLDAVAAARGQAPCPSCGAVIHHTCQPEEILTCPTCGWRLSWCDYFKTIQHKQLSGAEPVMVLFGDFIARFPEAAGPAEKMALIDRLIHTFHWWAQGETETRAAAVNLIEGSYHEVVEFLNRLSYGTLSTPGTAQTRLDWRETIQRTASMWNDERLKRME